MLEVVKNPVAYFFTMIVVLSVASLPPSPPTLMAAKANPAWLLASLAAVAGAVAAVVDYHLVRRTFRVRTLERVRRHPLFARAERWAAVAPFFTVALFAAIPLPFIIPRVLVPLSGYPIHRYAAAVAVGRWPRVFVLAAFGRIIPIPGWAIDALFVGGVVVAIVGALVQRSRAPSPEPARGVAEASGSPPRLDPEDQPPA